MSLPERDRAIRVYIMRMIGSKASDLEILQGLTSKGANEEELIKASKSILSMRKRPLSTYMDRIPETSKSQNYSSVRLSIGLGLIAIGTITTILSYIHPTSKGYYHIWYGPILVGLKFSIFELFHYYKPKNEVDIDAPLPNRTDKDKYYEKDHKPPGLALLRFFGGFFLFFGTLLLLASSTQPYDILYSIGFITSGYLLMYGRKLGVLLIGIASLYMIYCAILVIFSHDPLATVTWGVILAFSISTALLTTGAVQGIINWNKLKWI